MGKASDGSYSIPLCERARTLFSLRRTACLVMDKQDETQINSTYRDYTEPLKDTDAQGASSNGPRSSSGWDGKLRVQPRNAVLTNPEALSDPEYSDPDAPPVEQIPADDDLLDDEDSEAEDIDLVHCRISSIPSLRLERFPKLKRLCLRQNAIEHIQCPSELGETLEELDLYDNLIKHIEEGDLQAFKHLRTLDLSFNKLKHIKNFPTLSSLVELYFVQNRIAKIENLDNLTSLTTIELAANRIRDIENLDKLTNLRELWLGKNKITEIRNISHLINLRLVDLKSNRLTAISGLDSLLGLEELYVSHNAITEISASSLHQNSKLRVLDISNNRITRLENISHLKELEEFWASANGISDFREVERELSNKEKLETVYFEANPLQLNGPAVYRNKVKLALPQVKQIDATFVRV
ncbi:protein phosphatase regulatory subunit Sds22 [Lithohypha guttulata]|uniref:protein phosphatase regulatory subunit Sds22 n=1 Tax=Lithohypha guttulata TaxID=1690604 RepID=UPI002DDDC4F4|nr:protein phosphatase regulatory subunit Sds22 [Lithohypha guttulata]KAK5100424.1 protein phosphatase regulatory subunit Sds22 [Lithohypha guttulata]